MQNKAHSLVDDLRKDGIPCKSQSQCESDAWTFTSVHTIQMGQSGFNLKQNQNDLTLGESHLFSTVKLNKL